MSTANISKFSSPLTVCNASPAYHLQKSGLSGKGATPTAAFSWHAVGEFNIGTLFHLLPFFFLFLFFLLCCELVAVCSCAFVLDVEVLPLELADLLLCLRVSCRETFEDSCLKKFLTPEAALCSCTLIVALCWKVIEKISRPATAAIGNGFEFPSGSVCFPNRRRHAARFACTRAARNLLR